MLSPTDLYDNSMSLSHSTSNHGDLVSSWVERQHRISIDGINLDQQRNQWDCGTNYSITFFDMSAKTSEFDMGMGELRVLRYGSGFSSLRRYENV